MRGKVNQRRVANFPRVGTACDHRMGGPCARVLGPWRHARRMSPGCVDKPICGRLRTWHYIYGGSPSSQRFTNSANASRQGQKILKGWRRETRQSLRSWDSCVVVSERGSRNSKGCHPVGETDEESQCIGRHEASYNFRGHLQTRIEY